MLHTKYQDSRLYGFRREDFFMFFTILAYVKHVTPGWSHFWPKGHYLNKLGKGPPDDATYQISRLYAIWLLTRIFFYVFHYISLY